MDEANAVFDVLVDLAGAPQQDRVNFVQNVTTRGLTEWRFMGLLGFGGKVRLAHYPRRFYVTAYPEDLTEEREAVIENTNAALEFVA